MRSDSSSRTGPQSAGRPRGTNKMVQRPTRSLPAVVPGNRNQPRLGVPTRKLPPLRIDGHTSATRSHTDDLSGLSDHGNPVVPDRLGEPGPTEPLETPERLHFALVVGDIRQFNALRNSAYVIGPPGWNARELKLHVMIKSPRQTEEEVLYKFALTELGMIDPEAHGLTYPETIELGIMEEHS